MKPFRQLWKIIKAKILVFLISCLYITNSIAGFSPKNIGETNTSYLIDYREPRGKILATALKNSKKNEIRIIQFGDSHTAAEFLTESFRNKIQNHYGVGSIGWITPIQIPGQRSSFVTHKNTGFKYINSLIHKDNYNFGGIIASSNISGQIIINHRNAGFNKSSVYINSRCKEFCELEIKQDDKLLSSSMVVGDNWRNNKFVIDKSKSFTIKSTGDLDISGIYINDSKVGVSVSSFGINGSTIFTMSKWENNWYKELKQILPNLLILAYGTNESLYDKVDMPSFKEEYKKQIREIRKNNPSVAILILSNPDSYRKSNKKVCDHKEINNVDKVNKILQEIAKEEKTLFWNWRLMMGGKCSMNNWLKNKLSTDGVHFTASGYQIIGEKLAIDLINWANKRLR